MADFPTETSPHWLFAPISLEDVKKLAAGLVLVIERTFDICLVPRLWLLTEAEAMVDRANDFWQAAHIARLLSPFTGLIHTLHSGLVEGSVHSGLKYVLNGLFLDIIMLKYGTVLHTI